MLFIAFIVANFVLHAIQAKTYKQLTLQQKITHNFQIIKTLSATLLPWMSANYILLHLSVAKMIMLQTPDPLIVPTAFFGPLHILGINYAATILDCLLCIYVSIES